MEELMHDRERAEAFVPADGSNADGRVWGEDLGLNLDEPETLTTVEFAELNRRHPHGLVGNYPDGFPSWSLFAAFRPDLIKRHRINWRSWARENADSGIPGVLGGVSDVHLYLLLDYQTGVSYMLPMLRYAGLSRAEVMDLFAVATLNTVAMGIVDAASPETHACLRDWPEVDVGARDAVFPAGWEADPEAFRSGMDFSQPETTAADLRALTSWYEKRLGEVPPYVKFYAEHQPMSLKAQRARWETAIKVLPRQMMPFLLLHFEMTRGFGDGIRENVLLAKAFGMSKAQVLATISYGALVNGGVASVSLVERVAGDVIRSW
jgi:hypothetical protein